MVVIAYYKLTRFLDSAASLSSAFLLISHDFSTFSPLERAYFSLCLSLQRIHLVADPLFTKCSPSLEIFAPLTPYDVHTRFMHYPYINIAECA
jgi:hypothetical protein